MKYIARFNLKVSLILKKCRLPAEELEGFSVGVFFFAAPYENLPLEIHFLSSENFGFDSSKSETKIDGKNFETSVFILFLTARNVLNGLYHVGREQL